MGPAKKHQEKINLPTYCFTCEECGWSAETTSKTVLTTQICQQCGKQMRRNYTSEACSGINDNFIGGIHMPTMPKNDKYIRPEHLSPREIAAHRRKHDKVYSRSEIKKRINDYNARVDHDPEKSLTLMSPQTFLELNNKKDA